MKSLRLLLPLAMALNAAAQLPNPSFEQGSGNAPSGWALSGGKGEWASGGHTGTRCVSVTGNGEESNYWRCDGAFDLSKLYRVRFYARCTPGTTGSLISGPSFANRDLSVSEQWDRKSFVFATPTVVDKGAHFRLGQWRVKGTVMFDNLELRPVLAVHTRPAGIELGDGEEVRGGVYYFRPNFAGDGGNYSRPLTAHSAGFNTDRWTFGPGSYVVYRHRVGSRTQKGATVNVSIGYYTAGKCMIETSFDLLKWSSAGEITGSGEKTVELPKLLFPAAEIYVRLRSENGDDGHSPNFQINSYRYEAPLIEPAPDVRGATHFVEVMLADKDLQGSCGSLGNPLPGGDHNTTWGLKNNSGEIIKVLSTLQLWRGDKVLGTTTKGTKLFPGLAEQIEMGYDVRDAGDYEMVFTTRDYVHNRDLFVARVPFSVPQLFASDYGWRLSELKDKVGLWWCESLRKIHRDREMPAGDQQTLIRISAARNERESFQLVIVPRKNVEKVSVSVSDLRGPGGAKIPAASVEVNRVGYVRVDVPTDPTGVAGEWPDPLPPLAPGEQFTPEPGRNTPLWFTVAVPDGIPAGDYQGTITLQARKRSAYDSNAWTAKVQLRVHVWNFTLPKETRLKTALGISVGTVKQYHNLASNDELAPVWEKYMRNFAAHRISPYWPMSLAEIGVTFDKSSNPPRVKLDWTKFDAAATHYLDELGFNTFRLPLNGLGWGGQGKPWHDGEFGGTKQGTPEYEALWGDYARQLSEHLEQKGWLRKAYLYWFDEPEPGDYASVRKNNEQIKRLAPKLTRMLTEEPGKELIGAVDIWCPVTPNYRAESCQPRQRAGEHVWWYICCSPHAPYCTEFIDHSAIEPRMWLWQTWRYGVEGILIWETNWWNQRAKFAPPARQNPWDDPMSYSETGNWGNGDGRFLYPPNPKNDTAQKFLDGPVNSIRWEILRDGVEDYEYFALLRELAKGQTEAVELLAVPPAVFTDMTHFNTNPAPLLEHREKLARAIERLGGK